MVYDSTHCQQRNLLKKTLLLISGKPCVETTKPPNNFGIQLVNNYYSKFKLKERLLFAKIESDEVIKILKTFDETKAPDIDDLSEIFLKRVQHYQRRQSHSYAICQFFSGRFPNAYKIAKLKPLFKKGSKTDPKNYCPISLSHLCQKFWRE